MSGPLLAGSTEQAPLNTQWQTINGIIADDDHIAAGTECQTDQIHAGGKNLGVGSSCRNAYDPAPPAESAACLSGCG